MNIFFVLLEIFSTIMTILRIYTIISTQNKSSEPYVYYINHKPESDTILKELANYIQKKLELMSLLFLVLTKIMKNFFQKEYQNLNQLLYLLNQDFSN